MPFYTFRCVNCDIEIEKLQSFEDAIPDCEQCYDILTKRKSKMKRMFGTPGFQLKGGGWFKDGYSKPKIQMSSGGKTIKTYSSKDQAEEAAGLTNEAAKKSK